MYACFDSFLYRSTDRGSSWEIITSHPKLYIYDIKVGNVLMGYCAFTATSNGIYRAYQGDNWERVYDEPSHIIILDRQLCQYIYAINNTGIIMRSTDEGDTWEEISPSISQTGWQYMEISPISATTIYASHFAGGFQSKGLYKSTDAGDNWQELRFKSGGANADTIVKDIDVSPRDQDIVYCIIRTSDYKAVQSEIWKSTNAGNMWIKKFSETASSEALRYLTISIPSPDTCFVLWNGQHHFYFLNMYWSTDEGETWSVYGPGYWPSLSTINHLCSSPAIDGVFAISGIDGLAMTESFLDPYYFSYCGFKPLNTTTNISVLNNDETKLICNGGSSLIGDFNKLWQTMDGGVNWTIYPSSYGMGDFGYEPVQVKWVISDRVYLIQNNTGPDSFSYSSNGGMSYTKVFQTPNNIDLSHFDLFNMNAVNLIGNGGTPQGCHFWHSEYPFSVWTEKSTYTSGFGNCVRLHPFCADTLFFGGFRWGTRADYCKFWKSADGGNNYINANQGLPAYQGANNQISTIVTGHSSPGLPVIIYCGLNKKSESSNAVLGVYKSTNHGDLWTDISFSPTHSIEIYELKVDYLDPSIIYAAASAGMYVTHDCGASWVQFNQGLETTNCYAVDLSTNQPHIFCGTDHSIFKYTPVSLQSGSSLATAYQARKMIVKDGLISYLCYQTPGGVYIGSSDLEGIQKQRLEGIKDGSYPALEADANGNPCVVWTRNCTYSPNIEKGELWFSRNDGMNWTEPFRLLEYASQYGCSLYTPAIVVDPSTDNAYVVCEKREKGLNGPLSSLHLIWFNITNPQNNETVLLADAWSPLRCEYPSLAYFNDTLYIAYQRDHKIYRIRRAVSTSNMVQQRISAPNRRSHHPFVDLEANGRLNYVWEDSTASNIEIYSAYEYNDRLHHRGNVSNTTGKSQWPQLCKGTTYITWSEYVSQPAWEIYYKDIEYPANYILSAPLTQSKYSHGIITYGLLEPQLTAIWTEGDASPYKLMVKSVYVNPRPAYFYVDAGTEEPSPWTVQRHGYIQYGEEPEKTVDYHPVELIYQFPDLKPNKRYQLKLVFYYESHIPQTRQLEINVDDLFYDHVTINPNEIKTIEQWLPEICYIDQEITLKIRKEKGAQAFVAQIMVYEYEQEIKVQKIAQQVRINDNFKAGKAFLNINPNPCQGKTIIRYSLPVSATSSYLKIYDAAGRLIKQHMLSPIHDNNNSNYYMTSFVWDCADADNRRVGSGIYFVMLESDMGSAKSHLVRKLIVTR